MTVDATASKSDGSAASTSSPSQTVSVMKKNRADVIKTIQEITKIDEFTINHAIEACQDSEGRYSMDQVLNFLMDENYSQENNQNAELQRTSNRTNQSGNSSSSSASNSNNDERYQLHKSRGSANVSGPNDRSNDYSSSGYGLSNNLDDDDDDDFDSYQSTNKNISNLSESNLLREDGKPSGLRNVGNTCWFNSIIQAFFHLPYLRNLILSFQIDQYDLNKLDENSKNVVQFVAELRKLFALMLKSKRKAINPNPTLRCLKNCSKYDSELFNQEDVSEFATILVNLIEESFDILFKLQQQQSEASSEGISISIQTDSASSLSSTQTPVKQIPSTTIKSNLIRKNKKNPIVKLLNGDILINRKNSDEDVTNSLIEIFREVNIQMLNARNLHAGLELEWGETSIDKLITSKNKNTQVPMNKSFYQQESWIKELPPVLFICLNRYKFVKATQSSSKIIEPFEFYPHIYLDRYMQSNRDLVKAKRKELQTYNNDLNKLETKLKSIKKYVYEDKEKNSQAEYPLDDILKCVLHFARTDLSSNEVFNTIKPISTGSTDQLSIVENCLQSWIQQTEDKIKQLELEIKDIKNKVETIFDEENLKKIKYNLHSVCIHEGNAVSGHFWTYIWNKQQQKWFKFNDTEVSESNWDDLYENAVGGNYTNKLNIDNMDQIKTIETTKNNNKMPSAYFLIYVKDDDPSLYQENNQIDTDLLKLINEDQESLVNQLQNLKLKQLLRDTLEKLRKSNVLINEALEKGSNKTSQSIEQNNQTCNEHAKAFSESTYEALSAAFDRISPNKPETAVSYGLEEALKYAVEIELNKYNDTAKDVLAKLPDNDLRTQHILSYFSCNSVPREIRAIAVYDLFRIQTFSENNIKLKLLQTYAQIKYNELFLASLSNASSNLASNQSPDLFKHYEKWQADYRDFRSIIAAFISAANYMESQKYEDAATFFCVACEYNERITANLSLRMKGMDHDFLLATRRRCLKQWNQYVLKRFTNSSLVSIPTATSDPTAINLQPVTQQDLTVLIETMITKFLPCFFRLATSTPEDKAMLDEIRQDWLGTLDSNLPELPVFHDFMAKLFDDPFANHFHSLNVNKTNLLTRYKEITQMIKKNRK